jgi:GPH family glycoside/pentoside/hexuronide:cation symporter
MGEVFTPMKSEASPSAPAFEAPVKSGSTASSCDGGDRVSFAAKFYYGIAGPVDIWGVWILVSIAYPLFNMELGMSPTQVAVILMSLRLWDGVADPVMGWFSDNFRSRWGRRRPFIVAGAILCGLTFPLIWWFPAGMSATATMTWVIGFGALFYTCFTVWSMPYQSMLMEMTPDYDERTRVAAVRGVLQSISSLAVGFAWWLALRPVFAGDDGQPSVANGMRYLSLIVGFLMIVLGVVPGLLCKERYYERVAKTPRSTRGPFADLGASFRSTLSNKPFLLLCAFTVFFLLGTSIYDSYGRYVGTYYVLGGDWEKSSVYQIYGTFIYVACSLCFIPIFRRLSERSGKIKTLSVALVLVLISGATTWWTNTPALPGLMLINTVFIGAGYAGLWLMIPSMQGDVIDGDELATGERREGSFAAVYSWVLKLSFCAGFLLSGPLLEWTGFDAKRGADQPPEVLYAMRIGYVALPVGALLVALVLLKFFPLTREVMERIRADLEARRGRI